MDKLWDAIVIGAGPAGASCAVWLKQLGLTPLLLETDTAPGGLLRTNSYLDVWTLTNPDMTGQDMAQQLTRQIQIAGLTVLCQHQVEQVRAASVGFEVTSRARVESPPQVAGATSGYLRTYRAKHVVVASGVTARAAAQMLPGVDYPGVLLGPGEQIMNHDFAGLKVAILGGGDNAFENALFVKNQGAKSAQVFARTVRAQRQFVSQVPAEDVVVGAVEFDPSAKTVNGQHFDRVLVLYGWQPRAEFLAPLNVARDPRGFIQVDPSTAQTNVAGLYAIGEVTQRMHPCVPTAMADGVVAAKAIESALKNAL